MGRGRRARAPPRVDVGNPHLVLRWAGAELPDRDELDRHRRRASTAPRPAASTSRSSLPGATAGELDMVVYERGVGPTLACGTGACAVAAAAHEWELVRRHRHRPHARRARPRSPSATRSLLTGDVTSVAILDTPWP